MMMLMNRILMKKILTMMTIMMARRSHMSVLLALLYPIVVDSTLKPGGVESRYHHVCDYRFYDDDDNDDDDDDDDDNNNNNNNDDNQVLHQVLPHRPDDRVPRNGVWSKALQAK